MRRARILFVVESITAAQVVRSIVLAKGLDASRYDVHFASGHFDEALFAGTSFRRWPLETIDAGVAARALERGRRLYDVRTLDRYVEAELAILREVQPDVVVSDFRLSLSVSAALLRIPRLTLINAYWSPYAERESWPLPDHPIVDLVGDARAARYFPQAMPYAFAHFAAPVNRLRQRRGLPPIGGLLEVLTDGDRTLYLDPPELVPMRGLPPHHHFIGMVPWSTPVPLPAGAFAPGHLPWVYVTLGSSGRADRLPIVLEALGELPVHVLVATAGRPIPRDVPPRAIVVDFVPGDEAARRAALVISNGGSTTGYQALAAGTPVLGLPSNLDQALASQALDRTAAARSLRAGAATVASVRSLAAEMLSSPHHRSAAAAVAHVLAQRDCHRGFRAALARVRAERGWAA